MIVILEKYGQLCNNIWSYIPLISISRRLNSRIFIFGFDNYVGSFNDLNCLSGVKFFAPLKKSSFLQKRYFRLLSRLSHFLLHDKKKRNILGIEVVSPWMYKNVLSNIEFRNYKNEISQIFRLKNGILNQINSFITSLKADIIIVVHIRRTDYKTYCEGKWYFEDDVYIKFIKQIDSVNNINKSFVICSDEEVDLSKYPSNVVKSPFSSALHDLCLMEHSTFIFGPHSTFSMLASFIGNVPLRHIERDDEIQNFNEFMVCKGLDVF